MLGRRFLFHDRREAGRVLAGKLDRYAGREDVVVLALPRGGVPVAYEVAEALAAPLDVFVVRKLGVPGHRELAMGALARSGVAVLDEGLIRSLRIGAAQIERMVAVELLELERREKEYRGDRDLPELGGRTVILVDDGLATGSTMRVAALAVREHHPARIVVAAPVAAAETCDALRREVDEVVCAATPRPFHAVGAWYDDFSQTSDREVRELLTAARHEAL
jgi:putative phosphoribosyl transferase